VTELVAAAIWAVGVAWRAAEGVEPLDPAAIVALAAVNKGLEDVTTAVADDLAGNLGEVEEMRASGTLGVEVIVAAALVGEATAAVAFVVEVTVATALVDEVTGVTS
jgi:hypothetical protein